MENNHLQQANVRHIRGRQTLLALACSEFELQHRSLQHQLGEAPADCELCRLFNYCQNELKENSKFLHEKLYKYRKVEEIK